MNRHGNLVSPSAPSLRWFRRVGDSSRHLRWGLLLLVLVASGFAGSSIGSAQERPRNRVGSFPEGRAVYLGRRVAQTMHYTGAEWLIRDEREREERCSLMLANLKVKPGMTVCDMGCGNGFYSLKLAKMVGQDGQVLGVDIQPEMLVLMRQRMEAEGIENVTPILGSMWDPRLPKASVDLILLVDVYHEFSHPQYMLQAMRRSLKPDGAIVLLEYRQEDPQVPIKPLHKMSKAQVDIEMRANGFRLVDSFDELPWQHMLYYGIDPEWTAPEGYPKAVMAIDAQDR